MKDFTYQGYMPYGAGQTYILDLYIEDNFRGNVVEHLINSCGAKWIQKGHNNAVLQLKGGLEVDFIRRG